MEDDIETPQSLRVSSTTWFLLVVLYVSFAFNIVAAPYIGAQSTHQPQATNRGNSPQK